LRNAPGAMPTTRWKTLLSAASLSYPTSFAISASERCVTDYQFIDPD
jgi:hypothetical protein